MTPLIDSTELTLKKKDVIYNNYVILRAVSQDMFDKYLYDNKQRSEYHSSQ